jgi:hypothetical protein
VCHVDATFMISNVPRKLAIALANKLARIAWAVPD